MKEVFGALIGAIFGAIAGFFFALVFGSAITPASEYESRVAIQLVLFVPLGIIFGAWLGVVMASDDTSAQSSKRIRSTNHQSGFQTRLLSSSIGSKEIANITSKRLSERKGHLLQARKQLSAVSRLIRQKKRQRQELEQKVRKASRISLLAKINSSKIARFEEDIMNIEFKLLDLEERQQRLEEEAKLDFGSYNEDLYSRLCAAFDNLMTSNRIWDITSNIPLNEYRSIATSAVERQLISAGYERLPQIHPEFDALCLANANGPDLCIYPNVLVLFQQGKGFGLIDIREIRVSYNYFNFVEEESVPQDCDIVNRTWKHAKKDGSRDRRYKNNYQIPVVGYGKMHFRSSSGLNEMYLISNSKNAENFAKSFDAYVEMFRLEKGAI